MRHSSSRRFRKTSPLPLLVLWLSCWMVGGVLHLACHLDEYAAKTPQPATPHPCLICQSLAQSGRSDIFTLTRALLQPTFITFYISHQSEPRPAAHAPAMALVFNRGPPSLLCA